MSLHEELTGYERRAGDQASIRDGERTELYSVTQLGVAYGFGQGFSGQLTLPLVARTFDEYSRFSKRTRTDTGIGDMVLSGHYTLYHADTPNRAFRVTSYAGVKVPTGDTGSLNQLDESEEEAPVGVFGRDHVAAASLGADALNFGSGSFDFPFGASASVRYERAFLTGLAQYTVRTEGSFDYEFGDGLALNLSSGYFLVHSDEGSLDARVVVSGERKADDRREGTSIPESDLTHLFLGPAIQWGSNSGWLASVSVEIPVYRDQRTGVKPDYRLQASVGSRF